MNTLAQHQSHHLTIEEYKNAFKIAETPFVFSFLAKGNRFLKETVFFMKFMSILFILIMLFVTMLMI